MIRKNPSPPSNSLGSLMEGFVKSARETTVPSMHGPVQLNKEFPPTPIQPMNRWFLEDKKRLRKCFLFRTTQQRNLFVYQMLEYENYSNHHAIEMMIGEKTVELLVGTKSMEMLTDLDKEYAKNADILFKDVCYVPLYEP